MAFYRLICYNKRKQVAYYRWYIYSSARSVAQQLLILKNDRGICSFHLDEFQNEMREQAERQDLKSLGLVRCRQCTCLHSDGNKMYCTKCLNKPYNKKIVEKGVQRG